MIKWTALVAPRLNTQDGAGWCLRFAQSFFGAPARYNSAWDAWNATQFKHGVSEGPPNVPVLMWFSHYGSYGSPPSYGNWGHVAIHVPGDAIYTSPGTGYGQERWANIGQIEQRFNARYVGWSEDINGLRVAQSVDILEMKDEDMKVIRHPNGTIASIGEFSIQEFTSLPQAGAEQKLFGNAIQLTAEEYAEVKKSALARRDAFLKLVPSGSGGSTGTTDYAKLAKAVNDDAAERRKGWK